MHDLNNALVDELFQGQTHLGQYPNLEGHSVRVMITHNVKKPVGIVNGARGVVISALSRSALLVQFDNGLIHPVSHITTDIGGIRKSGLPMSLAYASTISKVQGQT